MNSIHIAIEFATIYKVSGELAQRLHHNWLLEALGLTVSTALLT